MRRKREAALFPPRDTCDVWWETFVAGLRAFWGALSVAMDPTITCWTLAITQPQKSIDPTSKIGGNQLFTFHWPLPTSEAHAWLSRSGKLHFPSSLSREEQGKQRSEQVSKSSVPSCTQSAADFHSINIKNAIAVRRVESQRKKWLQGIYNYLYTNNNSEEEEKSFRRRGKEGKRRKWEKYQKKNFKFSVFLSRVVCLAICRVCRPKVFFVSRCTTSKVLKCDSLSDTITVDKQKTQEINENNVKKYLVAFFSSFFLVFITEITISVFLSPLRSLSPVLCVALTRKKRRRTKESKNRYREIKSHTFGVLCCDIELRADEQTTKQ